MNKVKKIAILLSVIMLIGSIFVSKTYAALNCNVSLNKPADKVTYEEQFSVYVSISNLQTTKGIIAIGGVLSYDTNSLTLVDIEGENKWSDPMHNASNGKFSSFKNKLSTSNENVLKITFKVNEKGKAGNSAWIKIDNFEISDGDEEKNCGGSYINIAIGESNGGNSGGNNQGGNNQGGNNQGGNNQGGNNQGGNNQGGNNQSGNSQGGNSQGGNSQGGNSQGGNSHGGSSNQGSSANVNNEQNTNHELNNNNAITGIDTNRVNEENTVKDNNPVVKKTDYISKEEPVKLYKQEDHSIIIYIACTVGALAIIGIGIFTKKKLEK